MECIRKSVTFFVLITITITATAAPSTGNEHRQAVKPATHIQLPALFSDNMVVQRNRYISVWGTADPGGQVQVVTDNDRQRVVVGNDGRWRVELDPLPTGGPYRISIIGTDTTTFENVLSGEVWVASGQSNMEMPLAGWGQVKNYKEEIANADFPDIRLLQVQRNTSANPLDDIEVDGGSWRLCSPETIPEFSAAAYFFARDLHKNLDIPVGIIHSSWGGTVAEAWTSRETLEAQFPEFDDELAMLDESADKKENAGVDPEVLQDTKQLNKLDPGYNHGQPQWASPTFNDSQWKQMELPNRWENAGLTGFDGVVWFRMTVDVPNSWSGKDLQLHLGPIDDNDQTWFNGTQVGHTENYMADRSYTVPGKLVKAGHNTIAVRVIDFRGGGGIWGKPGQMSLAGQGDQSISLAGSWRYHVGLKADTEDPNVPSLLYNAMIHPLIPFTMRGVIWYQGESNAGRAYQYRDLFSSMITDWRENWGEGNFPFLFVQLANYMAVQDEPVESEWAELREAQLMALSKPNTGMAVTIDIGNAEDIHPKNKQEVGRRLALIARSQVYGEDVAYSGPIYRSMEKVEDNKIRLSFNHTNGGLLAKGSDELKGFAIAGEDHEFHWAEARIIGDKVVVWSPEVPNPVAVRYAWASNPVCNLYNGEGLPASPFRTDDWGGITEGRKK